MDLEPTITGSASSADNGRMVHVELPLSRFNYHGTYRFRVGSMCGQPRVRTFTIQVENSTVTDSILSNSPVATRLRAGPGFTGMFRGTTDSAPGDGLSLLQADEDGQGHKGHR